MIDDIAVLIHYIVDLSIAIIIAPATNFRRPYMDSRIIVPAILLTLFFQFISRRYERTSTIITSNKSFSEWEEMFDDPVIASAMLDRLLHHCRVINIKGNSYRTKGYKENSPR